MAAVHGTARPDKTSRRSSHKTRRVGNTLSKLVPIGLAAVIAVLFVGCGSASSTGGET
jgi:hypothetical protein